MLHWQCGCREEPDRVPDLWKPSLAKQTDLEVDNRSPVCYCLASPRQTPLYTGETNNETTQKLPVTLPASPSPLDLEPLLVTRGQADNTGHSHPNSPKGPSFLIQPDTKGAALGWFWRVRGRRIRHGPALGDFTGQWAWGTADT